VYIATAVAALLAGGTGIAPMVNLSHAILKNNEDKVKVRQISLHFHSFCPLNPKLPCALLLLLHPCGDSACAVSLLAAATLWQLMRM
jgi:hypothetical protein